MTKPLIFFLYNTDRNRHYSFIDVHLSYITINTKLINPNDELCLFFWQTFDLLSFVYMFST